MVHTKKCEGFFFERGHLAIFPSQSAMMKCNHIFEKKKGYKALFVCQTEKNILDHPHVFLNHFELKKWKYVTVVRF